MNWLVILLGILILFIAIFIFTRASFSIFTFKQKFETWEAPSLIHINNIIDNSQFFRRMTPLDLLARHATSIEEYINTYKANIQTFTLNESKMLDSLIKEINEKYIERYHRLKHIKWKFVKLDESIEQGYPHTISDSIFLSHNFFKNPRIHQIETLIHEKMHVFQRFFPLLNATLITRLGFKPFNTQQAYPNIRNNPDTDSFVYINQDTVQAQIYDSDTPISIAESHTTLLEGTTPWDCPTSVHQHDHPFELLATSISQLMIGNLSNHSYKQNIYEWMLQNL